jgi:DNA primase
VQAEVRRAGAMRQPNGEQLAASSMNSQSTRPSQARLSLSNLQQTPALRLERDALMAMVQHPQEIGAELLSQAVTAAFSDDSLRVVRDVIGASLPFVEGSPWVERMLNEAPEPYRELIRQLAVAPMPQNNPALVGLYARDIVASLLDRDLLSLKAELVSRMQRIGDSSDPASRQIQEQLASLELARRSLRAG